MKYVTLAVVITAQLFIRATAQNPPATAAQAAARITPGAPPVTGASVAGTYHYKTYRPGKEGYDNTLKVEDKGGGKLHISLEGAYMYRANGAETMHEGDGEGDATLRANVATASMSSGGESPCRVVIIFEGDKARVKTGDPCNLNVDFNGTYIKEKARRRQQRGRHRRRPAPDEG